MLTSEARVWPTAELMLIQVLRKLQGAWGVLMMAYRSGDDLQTDGESPRNESEDVEEIGGNI